MSFAKTFSTINPHSGETLAEYRYHTEKESEASLSVAASTFQHWKIASLGERQNFLKSWASRLRNHSQEFASIMAQEMGKPVTEGLLEVEKCAFTIDYLAEHAEKLLANAELNAHYAKSYLVKDSLGVILAIMPWNYPLWQFVRFAAPSFLIGNTVLLKHSDLTAGTADLLRKSVFESAPFEIMQNLRLPNELTAKLIQDRRVRGVTFTGSPRGGSQVAAVAGAALKKCVLELGGSDPYLVLHDAEVEKAARMCASTRLINNGQSCVAAKRFLINENIYEEFVGFFIDEVRRHRVGDPMKKETHLGPLAAKRFQKELFDQCQRVENDGAKLLYSAFELELSQDSSYFPSRVYEINSYSNLICSEEFFGPVGLVKKCKSEKEMIELANATLFGLGAAVFSSDIDRAWKVALQLDCGMVAINDRVKSDVRMPFGGVKDSGFGKELGFAGFDEFVNLKALGVCQYVP